MAQSFNKHQYRKHARCSERLNSFLFLISCWWRVRALFSSLHRHLWKCSLLTWTKVERSSADVLVTCMTLQYIKTVCCVIKQPLNASREHVINFPACSNKCPLHRPGQGLLRALAADNRRAIDLLVLESEVTPWLCWVPLMRRTAECIGSGLRWCKAVVPSSYASRRE